MNELMKRQLYTYICNSKQLSTANLCIEVLERLSSLKVYEAQYSKPKNYTCWYTSFAHHEEPWILNFTIYPSYANVEFRYPQYIPNNILDSLEWQNKNWKYARLTELTKRDVEGTLTIYLNSIREDFDQSKLRQGGKSFAEGFIANMVQDIFHGDRVIRNSRPDWLRSDKQRSLELDIHVPEKNLAIEIQGPQHFNDLYSREEQHLRRLENDLFKKKTCRSRGTRLIWMYWEGVNESLMKLPYKMRLGILRDQINGFINSEYAFLVWKNVKELHFE